ncbi:hypothetical protein VSDG_03220 [Cytospora chrysosperma]|uniref:Cytochrome P450 n=1 Tax=Cytospora chrysosperma TaxID=252740 RepID=A0A423WBB9_CYTCH|nr:hypothetical protein VSDG_03220 [Valsa sordida]
MDLGEKTQFFALDCIGDFAFGEPFGFLQRDEDVRRITQINDLSLRMATVAGLIPWFVRFRSKWPFSLLVPREGDQVGFGTLFSFAKSLVDKRTAEGAESANDMMQAFIRSGMTKDQLMQQVYVHIVAGSDSTSNWARMTMLCLLTCPPAYMALQREIDAASAGGILSGPIAKSKETSTLPYLDAVLREAIRLYPPAVAPSKLSPKTPRNKSAAINHTVCGFHVPEGTQIGANVPGILRSEAIFGSDAQCFRPERWLEAVGLEGQERLSRMKSTLDIVFGAGKYQCLGATISWTEMRKLFVELMRRFDFALVDNVKPLRLESFAIMVVHGFNFVYG